MRIKSLLTALFLAFGLIVIVGLPGIGMPAQPQAAVAPTMLENANASTLPQSVVAQAGAPQVESQPIEQTLANLPLRFVPNAGQTDLAVQFTVKGAGHTFFFTPQEIVLAASLRMTPSLGAAAAAWPSSTLAPDVKQQVVRLRFAGANPASIIEGLEPLAGVTNFFLGNDPAKWRVNVPTYAALIYRQLYPGIDLVYRGSDGRLKSEFHLAAGADPAAIRLEYQGVKSAHVRQDGALVLQTPLGELIEQAPQVYQEIDGMRQAIAGGYALRGSLPCAECEGEVYRVGFEIAPYNPAYPLVIDPVLIFSTYLGGSDTDYGYDIAVDDVGNIYVTGDTHSIDFPVYNSTDANLGGYVDAFVTKIIYANGIYTFSYSTYLGGSDFDYGLGIAVDDVGNIYVTGATQSSDFPIYNAIDSTLGGGGDGFVTQIISASGVYTFGYSTYFGGSDSDYGYGIALGNAGDAYVTGETRSSDLPTYNALDTTLGGVNDVLVTHIISASGVYTFGYSTYLGGSSEDWRGGIAVDSTGNAYVAGYTSSSDFPTYNAIDATYGGSYDGFVTQIISSGGVYTYGYSTYIGGSGGDGCTDIAVDGAGKVYVTGGTSSSDFPIYNAIDTTKGGFGDSFVTKIVSVSGVYTYGYSTYLGGSNDDNGDGIAIDDAGNAFVTGWTVSSDFPTRNAIDATYEGVGDAFVTHIIRVSGVYTYGYSTYLGGSDHEGGSSIAVDGRGDAYVIGDTSSNDFPTSNAIDTILGGTDDAFIAKISPLAGFVRYVATTGTDTTDCANSAAPCRTVQYAVDQAYDSDEIRIATGVYTGVNAYGGLSQVVYISKTVSVRGGYTTTNWTAPNPISYPTTLDAQAQGRVMYITGSISPTVEGLRITGGQASTDGGVYVVTATATISNCHVFGNATRGMYLYYSPATLINNTISTNSGSGLGLEHSNAVVINNAITSNSGSGVYLYYSHATLISNTISGNTGGGVYVSYSPATLTGNIISNNTNVVWGGGVYLYHSHNANLSGNIISYNTSDWGGGICLEDSDNANLSGNIISYNTSDWGGGIYLYHSHNTITSDNIISNNSSSASGGGIYLIDSDKAVFLRNTITDNISTNWGGGVQLRAYNNFIAHATFEDNIVISNTTSGLGGGMALLPGGIVTLTRNIIANNTANSGGGLELGAGSFILYDNIISGNTAGTGGGLEEIGAADVAITNTIIANNHANYWAGGLYIYDSPTRMWHTTIARNTANDGSGIYIDYHNPNSPYSPTTLAMTNTILVSHTIGISVSAGNTVTVNGILWYSTPITIAQSPATTVTVQNEYWGDPAFAADGYHLTSASAAIDRGVPVSVTTDIDGDPRPMGNGFDLGADESPFSLLAPGNPILLAPPNGTITAAQAITLAWQAGAGSLPDGYNLKLGNTIITTTNTISPAILSIGVHTWTVRAFNIIGYSDWAAAWVAQVITRPGVPVLLSPPNGTVTATQAITFTWQAGAGDPPNGYNFQLDGATFTVTNASSPTLLPVGVHTWTVRAFNTAGYSNWVTPAWTIEVTTGLTAPGMPTLLSPPSGTVTTTQAITFAWQAGTGDPPEGYNLQVDGATFTTTATVSPTLLPVGVHTWTVRAFNAAGYSNWVTPAWTIEITTGLAMPGVPVLLSPPSGAVTTTQAITFTWQAGAGDLPEGYNLQLDGATFTTTNTSSLTLLPLGVHTWTVRAFNAAGYSAWAGPAWTVEVKRYYLYLPIVFK